MNLPNKLTMLRILLIPVFMVFVELDSLPGHMLWAFAVFVAASLTDMIDHGILHRIAFLHRIIRDFSLHCKLVVDERIALDSTDIDRLQIQLLSLLSRYLPVANPFAASSKVSLAALPIMSAPFCCISRSEPLKVFWILIF